MSSRDDIDRLVIQVKEAARNLLENPLRHGNLIRLRDGEVMVTGDLHGDLRAFNRIVELADLAARPRRHLILQELIHHKESPQVCPSCLLIEEAVRLVNRFPERVHILMGNHEMAELTGRPILKNGNVLNDAFERGLLQRYGERSGEVEMYFQALWRSLALAARTPNRVFISHSTPKRRWLEDFDVSVLDRPLEGADVERPGPAYALVWGRDFSDEAADEFAQMVDVDFFVVGHTPCPDGFDVPNRRHVVLDSQGPAAACLMLEVQGSLTLEEIVGRIRPLWV